MTLVIALVFNFFMCLNNFISIFSTNFVVFEQIHDLKQNQVVLSSFYKLFLHFQKFQCMLNFLRCFRLFNFLSILELSLRIGLSFKVVSNWFPKLFTITRLTFSTIEIGFQKLISIIWFLPIFMTFGDLYLFFDLYF